MNAPTNAPALTINGFGKSFGGVHAVEDVSFTVPDGSVAALIGPNGAGKTTLFNLITNFFAADAGEARFYGTPLTGLAPERIARLGLQRTFQTARVFPGMTTLDNVLVGAHRRVRSHGVRQMLWLPRARHEERELAAEARTLLDLVGLSAFSAAAATSLPMGAQKLVEVCRALMARPRMLLLDEPAAGLTDAETAEFASLLRAIRDSGITILVVEHNMSLVMDVADDVIVLDLGRLIARGSPAEVQRDARVVEAYLGAEMS
jgi:branched-chain amino acid transport system ATP-binding protein